MQVDGSWDRKSGKVGWGLAVLNSLNFEPGASVGQYGRATSTVHAEAKACLLALEWATSKHIRRFRVDTDSSGLVSSLRRNCVDDVSIMGILEEIKTLWKTFNQCSILKVPRENVCQAHNMATNCRILGCSFN